MEFVCLMGCLLGLIALSLDNLLPAFGAIQEHFALDSNNRTQYVVTAYIAGFGIMQIVYGVLSDVLGRRPTLMIGLSIFLGGGIVAAVAPTFELLILGRAIQGMGAAAARVLTDTIIRDRFAGREMARVLSLTVMIFIVIQVLAPITGQLTLFIADWRVIVLTMLVLGLTQLVWFICRMPETLRAEYKIAFSVRQIISNIKYCVGVRMFFGYAMGFGLMQATLIAYLGSAPALFGPELYNLGPYFSVVFGAIAIAMGLASVTNYALVRRLGMRVVSHISLIAFILVSAAQLGAGIFYDGSTPIALFTGLLAFSMYLFILISSNFTAIAMEPVGSAAGTAGSLIGTQANVIGAFLGSIVGFAFDGTVVPFAISFFGLGVATALVVLWTERGKILVAHS